MKRFSLLPNVITAFGLSCGLFVIFKTMLLEAGENAFTLLQSASILILIASFADVADGAIARLIKAESDFGGEFDSLSDSVTFGVAPPLLILKALSSIHYGRFFNLLFIMTAMVFTLCGVLRLVRFNLTRKMKKKDQPKVPRRYFVGLPIPGGAALVLSACLILLSPQLEGVFSLYSPLRAYLMMGVLLVTGYCMVSRLRFPSLVALYLKVPTFYLVIAIGVFAVFILYGLLAFFAWVFFAISWGYFTLALAWSLARRLSGKKVVVDIDPTMVEDVDSIYPES